MHHPRLLCRTNFYLFFDRSRRRVMLEKKLKNVWMKGLGFSNQLGEENKVLFFLRVFGCIMLSEKFLLNLEGTL